jgi:hypothetical protein
MSLRLGPRQVVAPDGVEWRVGRRWLTRSPKLTRPRRGDVAAESLEHLGASWPDIGNIDFGEGLLVAAAVVAFLLILIPVLFFGIELITLGVLLAAGVITRSVLGQPWVIEARSTDPLTADVSSNGAFGDGGSPARSSHRSLRISRLGATRMRADCRFDRRP